MLRTIISIFDHNGKRVEALVQAMPRSFKMHVWANYVDPSVIKTEDLIYLGHIQPMDQTDTAELEMCVADLFDKEYHKRIDKTELV